MEWWTASHFDFKMKPNYYIQTFCVMASRIFYILNILYLIGSNMITKKKKKKKHWRIDENVKTIPTVCHILDPQNIPGSLCNTNIVHNSAKQNWNQFKFRNLSLFEYTCRPTCYGCYKIRMEELLIVLWSLFWFFRRDWMILKVWKNLFQETVSSQKNEWLH